MTIEVTTLSIPDVLIISPEIHRDERGYFFESFNASEFMEAVGYPVQFVQDNQSFSRKNTIRGLHYQEGQGKLVRVLEGSMLDVFVDLRPSSKSYGKHLAIKLFAHSKDCLWIPPGFAHGFAVSSPYAEVSYKVTTHRDSAGERILQWDDPALGIDWGIANPILSARDKAGTLLKDWQ